MSAFAPNPLASATTTTTVALAVKRPPKAQQHPDASGRCTCTRPDTRPLSANLPPVCLQQLYSPGLRGAANCCLLAVSARSQKRMLPSAAQVAAQHMPSCCCPAGAGLPWLLLLPGGSTGWTSQMLPVWPVRLMTLVICGTGAKHQQQEQQHGQVRPWTRCTDTFTRQQLAAAEWSGSLAHGHTQTLCLHVPASPTIRQQLQAVAC